MLGKIKDAKKHPRNYEGVWALRSHSRPARLILALIAFIPHVLK